MISRSETLAVVNNLATDQKTMAERQWQSSSKAPAPQQACDVGLFGDGHKQTDLFASNIKGKAT